MKIKKLALVLILPLVSALLSGAVPALQSGGDWFVHDGAAVLSDDHIIRMQRISEELRERTGVSLIVLTAHAIDENLTQALHALREDTENLFGQTGVIIVYAAVPPACVVYVGNALRDLFTERQILSFEQDIIASINNAGVSAGLMEGHLALASYIAYHIVDTAPDEQADSVFEDEEIDLVTPIAAIIFFCVIIIVALRINARARKRVEEVKKITANLTAKRFDDFRPGPDKAEQQSFRAASELEIYPAEENIYLDNEK